MIYNANVEGENVLIYHLSTGINPVYFLTNVVNPCGSENKTAILRSEKCGDYYKIGFSGVNQGSEDLLDGDVYFSSIGTWNMQLYVQDNGVNTDFNNAEFIETIDVQLNHG